MTFGLIILLLVYLFGCMTLFRMAALRPPEMTAEEKLDVWERERGWDVERPRAGVAWYRTWEKETVTAVSFDGLLLVADLLPAEGPSKGRVLMFHGAGGNGDQFREHFRAPPWISFYRRTESEFCRRTL